MEFIKFYYMVSVITCYTAGNSQMQIKVDICFGFYKKQNNPSPWGKVTYA